MGNDTIGCKPQIILVSGMSSYTQADGNLNYNYREIQQEDQKVHVEILGIRSLQGSCHLCYHNNLGKHH